MIIDGHRIADQIKNNLKQDIAKLDQKPGLAVVLIGDNNESQIYVKAKEKIARELGISFEIISLAKEITKEKVLAEIEKLNKNKKINGIIVQLPLPEHLDSQETINAIDPAKDVDGLTDINLGRFYRQKKIPKQMIIPATAKAVLTLIESINYQLAGKLAVVIGRSNLGGKSIAHLLSCQDATIVLCHSKTRDLARLTIQADVLVVSVGIPKLITSAMVKKGTVVIDVGINRTDQGIVGDLDFQEVKDKAGYITPVPGGVGPMTIISLMENTLQAYFYQH